MVHTGAAGIGSRLMRGLVGVGAVLGIVAASCIGLNDWADAVAVHVTPQQSASGQSPTDG